MKYASLLSGVLVSLIAVCGLVACGDGEGSDDKDRRDTTVQDPNVSADEKKDGTNAPLTDEKKHDSDSLKPVKQSEFPKCPTYECFCNIELPGSALSRCQLRRVISSISHFVPFI